MPTPTTRRGGYHSRGAQYRDDLGFSCDSAWEANFFRISQYLKTHGSLLGYQREHFCIALPTSSHPATTGNYHVNIDAVWYLPYPGVNLPLQLRLPDLAHYHGVVPVYIEIKGRLPFGGWLHEMTKEQISVLDQRGDSDSKVKLLRLRTRTEWQETPIWIIGAHDYAQLTRTYQAKCPNWES